MAVISRISSSVQASVASVCLDVISRWQQLVFVGGTVSVHPCLSMFVAVPLAPTEKISRASLTSPDALMPLGLTIEMFQLRSSWVKINTASGECSISGNVCGFGFVWNLDFNSPQHARYAQQILAYNIHISCIFSGSFESFCKVFLGVHFGFLQGQPRVNSGFFPGCFCFKYVDGAKSLGSQTESHQVMLSQNSGCKAL